jgi:endoglucanase
MPRLRPALLLALALSPAVPARAADAPPADAFNYAEALQKSLYFYEAQQSGTLSPNNRVPWRGPACLTDGQDIGRDLSGGWFDAGDHWTANLTMAFAAMTLAWSALEQPDGYLKTGQMDELLESLVHVNRYFLKCVLNPDCKDPAADLDVVIGCGGREGVDAQNVHSIWAAAEVAQLMTRRPTFRVNTQAPAGDIPAAMAAAMAASAMVLRDHAAVLKGRRGYADFDAAAFADTLIDRAEKLVLFARANAGPALTDNLPKEEQEAISRRREQALRADGMVVATGYRAGPFDKIFAAATFLARARAKDPQAGTRWLEFAMAVYEKEYKAENNHDFWKDYGAGHFGKVGAFNMMRLAPADERFHAELQLYCVSFTKYKATPGGLRLREWDAHEYGSLRHANNAAAIALYYSPFVEQSPKLSGNTWWKGNLTNAQMKELFAAEARRQVDYALGANPYRRSYLVGFGRQPFNDVHHRGAYGAWAGFDHFIPGKADDRGTCRHVLYGALVAGPDHNDVFLCGKDRRLWKPAPDGKGHGFFYKFPNRPEPVFKDAYRWDPADPPAQNVMDSQFNEVALDYNAGFTASLAWLCARDPGAGGPIPDAQFPPREARNDSTDLRATDREFFVSARELARTADGVEIEATLHNRSRWPSRVCDRLSFRYYFTLDGATTPEQVKASVSGAETATAGPATALAGKTAYIEVSFPGDAIHPGNQKAGQRTVKLKLSAPAWDPSNDWSHDGLAAKVLLQPRIPVYAAGRRVGGDEPPGR